MTSFSQILFHAHSGLRYLVLAAGVVSFLYSLTALIRGRPWNPTGRGLFTAFVGLLDLQILLGIILIFNRTFFPALWGHLSMMILAAAAAHAASAIQKRRPPEQQSHRLAVIGAGGALLLIVGGILSIGRPVV